MQTLVPIRFTHEIERLEYRDPRFFECVPLKTYFVTPFAYDLLRGVQEGWGVTIVEQDDVAITVPYWQGEDLNGKRVLYLADGMLGDQCIHTAVYRQLKRDYPRVDLHAYCHRIITENHRITSYNRDIGHQPKAFRLTLSEEQIEAMDYVVAPTNVGAEYRGLREETHYELLEEDLGISIEHKFPYIYLPTIEREAVRTIVQSAAVSAAGKEHGGTYWPRFEQGYSVIVQLNSSEEARTPRAEFWVKLLTLLRQNLPSHVFGICADLEYMAAFMRAGGNAIQGILPLSNKQTDPGAYLSAHGILHLLKPAALCIAPDSFLMHASAAFDVPCLAVWQDDPALIVEHRIPSPQSRIKHYEYVQSVGMSEDVEGAVERALRAIRTKSN